jgi:hypothetical protein
MGVDGPERAEMPRGRNALDECGLSQTIHIAMPRPYRDALTSDSRFFAF